MVITNQAGMGSGKLKKEDFRLKVSQIVKKLDVPIQLFCATAKWVNFYTVKKITILMFFVIQALCFPVSRIPKTTKNDTKCHLIF